MNALTRFERLDDMFPEMVRRFMRPTQMNFDAPGEIRVDVSETDKEYREAGAFRSDPCQGGRARSAHA
ncbi:MAG TPA: hypothetical protein VES36_01160, partial [Candidatus Limnocylindrales bacterium]|nr:hypothetical protein [Candidatus Limnocylindrales bacterium]